MSDDKPPITIRGHKCDNRPPLGGWAPGYYGNQCCECKEWYTGDKRSVVCADCAYNGKSQVITNNSLELDPDCERLLGDE